MRTAALLALLGFVGVLLGALAGLWLAQFAPDYLASAFGPAATGRPVAARIGMLQGLLGGLAVGAALAVASSWLDAPLGVAARRALQCAVPSTLVAALLGASIGAAIARLAPDYYLRLFATTAAARSATQLGAGLGFVQGIGVGALVGALWTITRLRSHARSVHARPRPGRAAVVALLLALPVAAVAFVAVGMAKNDRGSLSTAREFARRLATVSPDGSPLPAGATLHRFGEREWVVVLSRTSHGLPFNGGGTLVFRASDGTTRAFGGHVCGSGFEVGLLDGAPSLEEFVAALRRNRFTELPGFDEARSADRDELMASSAVLRAAILGFAARNERMPSSIEELATFVESSIDEPAAVHRFVVDGEWRATMASGATAAWVYEPIGDDRCAIRCVSAPELRARLGPESEWRWSE
ncbi:MAG: hypothetical protein JNM94_01355 [Phycisphaerae bacterium]|nr:hypothetical protein [Phycisphaerae bacterium]